MNTASRTGLVVGKFWPPHRGHQLLLETAAAQVAELLVFVYANPDSPSHPAAARADWLRMLYRGDEGRDGPASAKRRYAYSHYRPQMMGCHPMRPTTQRSARLCGNGWCGRAFELMSFSAARHTGPALPNTWACRT